jgi:4-amino-4-deoxy-L-arabinose transferase-like glycosyltransferase
VRAEAYLTTFIIAATYHIYSSTSSRFSVHIVWAAVFCSAACITKGIFIVITIASGFIIYWLYNKQWKEFLQPKWWLLVLLTIVFILPELYCLYQQFDLHPEKIVFGKTNVSGIRFFFWDSQFGRFLNNGPIKGEGDAFFFLHTFLWAFLPWSLIAYTAIFVSFKNLHKKNSIQLILSGAATVTFVLFSLSKFQLPHYIVIVFPHFAMLTSVYLVGIQKEVVLKRWNILQMLTFFIALIAVCLIALITKFNPLQWPLLLVLTALMAFYFYCRKNDLDGLVGKAVCFSTLLFSYMGLFFYPALLEYQGGKQAGKFMAREYPQRLAIMYKCSAYSFEWNTPGMVNRSESLQEYFLKDTVLLVFTTPEDLDSLARETKSVKEIGRFKNYPVSQLSLPFLKAATREKELDYFLLLECKGK